MNRYRNRLAGLCAVVLAAPALAVDLGTVGTVYEIAEPDAMDEIQTRAAAVDWKARLSSIDAAGAAILAPLSLPRVQEARVREVIPRYTLPFDLPDRDGGVLYPKGYQFNPLAYTTARVPLRLAAFDGGDPDQVDWAKALVASEGLDGPTLLATGGDVRALGGMVGRPVFALTRPMAELLQLERVPARLDSQGAAVTIHEMVPPPRREEHP